MPATEINEALARVSAETAERVRASAASVERTNRHVEVSRKALDLSFETLASTDQSRPLSKR